VGVLCVSLIRVLHANFSRFKEDADVEPLKPLQVGGGKCATDEDCGGGGEIGGEASSADGQAMTTTTTTTTTLNSKKTTTAISRVQSRGRCKGNNHENNPSSSSSCECRKGWIGPTCLAAAAWDPVDWDKLVNADTLLPGSFAPPTVSTSPVLLGFLATLALAAVLSVGWRVFKVRQKRRRSRNTVCTTDQPMVLSSRSDSSPQQPTNNRSGVVRVIYPQPPPNASAAARSSTEIDEASDRVSSFKKLYREDSFENICACRRHVFLLYFSLPGISFFCHCRQHQ
jgi:hypothetical protein